jgi:hypothetical protein
MAKQKGRKKDPPKPPKRTDLNKHERSDSSQKKGTGPRDKK